MEKRQRGSCSEKDTTYNEKMKAHNLLRKVMMESEDASIDRISMLPDALLISILSNLTFKECTATSILSRRWRYMWTLVPKLDFEDKKSLIKEKMSKNLKLLIDEITAIDYVNWVDHVIALHKSCTIDDFRLCSNLTKPYEEYIDSWVKYALARKVKRLELDFTYRGSVVFPISFVDCYTFPYKFMRQYEENCSNDLQYSMSQNTIHFKYLEKISLHYVNVNGEALEFFLSNCPLLQHLCVSESKELSTLKLIGPFPSLKHLEIMSCHNLDSFKIRDTNFVYFKYVGISIPQFVLENVPLLVEIDISGLMEMIDFLSMFSSILPQLEKFSIQFGIFLNWEVTEMFYSAVTMSNLKQLVLRVHYYDSQLPLTNILRASPCLETFELQICPQKNIRKWDLQKVEGSYIHLKEIKIRGYYGTIGDLELVMHLSESAGTLEKIVIDPHNPFITEHIKNNPGLKDMYILEERKARIQSKKQLLEKLPPRINLQIL